VEAKGKILIFSAPSGSGKTTVVKKIMELFPKLVFSISATTRPKRGQEEHGKDYFFLSTEEFKEKIFAGEFIEFEEVYPGRFYGTLKEEVNKKLALGKIVVFDIDVEGGIQLKRLYKSRALAFFISAPSLKTLEQRLRARDTDSNEDIEVRLAKASQEITKSKHFDHIVINDNLEQCVTKVVSYITRFLHV
jgi:guanylate kinase